VRRRSPTWAAVRYRGSQSVALVLVSALVTACAVFAPLFVRTLEQGLLRAALVERDAADTTVVVRASRTAGNSGVGPADLAGVLPVEAGPWFGDPVGMLTADTSVRPREGLKPSPLRLVARDAVCDHVDVLSGRCPSEPGEVLVSSADAGAWGWEEGRTFEVPDPSTTGGDGATAEPVRLTVVGVYRSRPDPGYWLRTEVDGKSGFPVGEGESVVPAVDDFLTAPATFDQGWGEAAASAEFPLERDRVSLGTLPRISGSLGGLERAGEEVSVSSPVPALVSGVSAGRTIVRTLVPLLLAQLALLAVTVLALVAHAVVEQRRPEVALARLRGRSREAGSRLVMAELTLTVLLGVPLGVVVALAGGEVLRRVVMPSGVPLEVRWPLALAAGLAVLASLAAVYAAARPVIREPVASLLRRVPPTVAKGLGVLDVVVTVVAVVAVAGLVSGDVEGPSAMVTPVLLALAVGLVGAWLLRRAAAGAGTRALSRGHLATGLAALSIARRPSLRHVLVVVTTATALATFAANAVVVADRNRGERARLELGAPAVLETDTTQAASLAAAVDGLPPQLRRLATPVVVIRPRDPSAVPTLLLRPEEARGIGYAVGSGGSGGSDGSDGSADFTALTPPVVPSVELADGVVTGTVTWQLDEFRTGDGPVGEAPPDATGIPGGDLFVEPTPLTVGVTVTTPDGTAFDRDLAQVEQSAEGRATVRAPVLCPGGCRLAGIWLRSTDPWAGHVAGRLVLSDLALDGEPLDLGGADRWLRPEADPGGGTQRLSGSGDELVVDFDNTGRRVLSRWADVPSPTPVLLAGRPPADARGDDFSLVGLGGRPVEARAVGRADALPVVGARGAVGDLDAQLRVGGAAPPGSALLVWLGSSDPELVSAVSKGLAAQGLPVRGTSTLEEVRGRYERSATGWGLLLGVVTGLVALLVSGLVVGVVAVTSWRGVARDLAGLVVSGVPRPVIARAARREQLTTVLAGVVLGTACGVGGAVLAMPLVPLFDRPAAVPVPDLAPAWAAIAATAATALVVTGLVAVLAARAVVARAVPERLRESL
jgi:putative ABC transport system permease protein